MNTNNKPWFTNGLRNACLKKNLLYKEFLKIEHSLFNLGISPIKQSSTYPESFDDNGKCVSDKNVAVNKFNQYFVNVGVDLANKIPVPKQNKSFHDYMVDSHETASNKFLLSAPFNIFFIMMHMKCTCAY